MHVEASSLSSLRWRIGSSYRKSFDRYSFPKTFARCIETLKAVREKQIKLGADVLDRKADRRE